MKMKRFLGLFLSLALVLGMIPGVSLTALAAVDASDKVPGTGAIRDPGAPTDAGWNGDYVYYGKYDGSNPTKYRVLDKDATEFGGNTMFLDCDRILYYDSFNKHNSQGNVWADSDVKTGLNGEKFLEKPDNFSNIEKAAIASSTVSEHDLVGAADKNTNEEGKVASWTCSAFGKYVPLDNDKVFLLDVEDVSNIKYGYRMTDSDAPERFKDYWDENSNKIWFLRSANTGLNYCVGCCMGNTLNWNADLNNNDVQFELGISPAFNVDLDSVIFTSRIPETSNEYKLTLLDNDIKITTANYSKSGNTVTVPYTVSGNHVANVTRISVLITDEPYYPGADITDGYAYEKLDVETDGIGTFTIPDSFKDKVWGEDYHVYILAEDENNGKETDYASAPAELYTVDVEKTRAKVTGYEGIYDGNAHGIDIKVTLPANGATVKYGEEEGTYNLDASPVITDVSDSPKTVYYKISAPGYKDSFGSSQIKIEKAPPVVTAPEAKTGLIYNGDEHDLVSSGIAEGGELWYALEKEGDSGVLNYSQKVPSAREAGTYLVWYKVKGDSNHKDSEAACVTVTIGKIAAAVTKAPAAGNLTYTGFDQELVAAGSASGGTMQYALGNATAATEAYTTSIPKGTEVGTYYVWYKVVGDEDHTDTIPVCVEVKIHSVDKADLNNAIADLETYYNSIKDEKIYSEISSALKTVIDDAKQVVSDEDIDETALNSCKAAVVKAKADAVAGKKEVDDTIAADKVTDAIGKLPAGDKVTVSDKSAIETAREAYNALTEDQKKKVSADVLGKLTDAEKALEEAEKKDAEKKAKAEQLAKDKEEFAKVQASAKNSAESLAVTGDSAASKKLIEEAGKAIEALKYDESMNLDQNKKAVNAILSRLKENLEAQRAADKKAAEGEGAKNTEAELEDAKKEAQVAMNEQVTVKQKGNKFTVKWKKSTSADGYDVYVQYSGKKSDKPSKTITNNTTTKATITAINGKKIDQKKIFRVYVVPYKIVDGEKVALGESTAAYVAGTKNTKFSNVKKITLKKSRYTVKAGKTAKIKAKVTLVDKNKKHLPKKYAAKFRYKSSDESIATVDGNGKIKGIQKGTCTIYVYSVNGLAKKATVTVQ